MYIVPVLLSSPARVARSV